VTFRQLFYMARRRDASAHPTGLNILASGTAPFIIKELKTFLNRKMGQVFGGMFENPVVPGLERSGSVKPANGKTARMILSKNSATLFKIML
jgi:hypothetical protein